MKKCDLVMKGGITSGIVYPAAVCELAREYRFINIGGTSAGAIAAALTGAAEFRRQNGSDAGFRQLEQLPEWLAGGDGRRLLSLFRPHHATAGLFDAAVAWLTTEGGGWRKARAALGVILRRFTRFSAIAIVPGTVVTVASLMSVGEGKAFAALAILAATIGLAATAVAYVIAACAEAAITLARKLPQQGYGLCSGSEDGALTAWLDARIRETAGVTHPLTFGDLEAHGVHLQVMTTNLTHGRPYRLPAETRRFFFSPAEWRRLFPADVVDALIAAAPPRRPRQRSANGEELYPLPAGAELPVIVATRMSLSFPILLSAVPLWSNDFARRDAPPDAERCWFSDGGVTSNFPVHFFDRALPRWPTFAFNLADWTPRYHRPGQNVYAPRSNMSGLNEWWTPIHDVGSFLFAIRNTMQNWRDNMLLHLPGQRDRIEHILLRREEGGLNLTMNAATIRAVSAKGREAAANLRARFSETPPEGVTLTWRNHKWVRFRAFMAAQEDALRNLSEAWHDRTFAPAYEDLLSGAVPLPSYRVSSEERTRMHAATRAFFAHVRENFEDRPFTSPRKRPRPVAELRVMPRE